LKPIDWNDVDMYYIQVKIYVQESSFYLKSYST